MTNNTCPGSAHVTRSYVAVSNGSGIVSTGRACRGLVAEFVADANGNVAGNVAIYLGQAITGIPFRILSASRMYAIPIEAPEGAVVTIVPFTGASGVIIVTLTSDYVQPFAGSV